MAKVTRIRGGKLARGLKGLGRSFGDVAQLGLQLEQIQQRKGFLEQQKEHLKTKNQSANRLGFFSLLSNIFKFSDKGFTKSTTPELHKMAQRAGMDVDIEGIISFANSASDQIRNTFSQMGTLNSRLVVALSKPENLTDDQLQTLTAEISRVYGEAIPALRGFDGPRKVATQGRDAALKTLDKIMTQRKLGISAKRSGFEAPDDVKFQEKTAGIELKKAQATKARAQAGAALQKAKASKLSKAQLSVFEREFDKKSAKDLASFSSGGNVNTLRNVKTLKDISEKLGDPDKNLSGNFTDFFPELLRDVTQSITNPEALDTRDVIRGVVFQSLRETLGAQFTEREGTRLVEATFNPKLDEKENKRRIDATIAALEQAADAKQAMLDFARKNGTLQGYAGPNVEQIEQQFTNSVDFEGKQASSSSGRVVRQKSTGKLFRVKEDGSLEELRGR